MTRTTAGGGIRFREVVVAKLAKHHCPKCLRPFKNLRGYKAHFHACPFAYVSTAR